MVPSQRPRVSGDMPQQHAVAQAREESQNRVQDMEKHAQNPPDHQGYVQYVQAAQQKPLHNLQAQQQEGTEIRSYQLKMQELLSLQAANLGHAMTRKPAEHYAHVETQVEQGHASTEQRSDLKSPQSSIGQFNTANISRPMQPPTSHSNVQNANNQIAMTLCKQYRLGRWSEILIFLFRLMPICLHNFFLFFSLRWLRHRKQMKAITLQTNHMHLHRSNKGAIKRSPLASFSINLQCTECYSNEWCRKTAALPITVGNATSSMHPPQSSGSISQNIEGSGAKSAFLGTETRQMQYLRQLQQLNRPAQPTTSSGEGMSVQHPSHGSSAQVPQQRIGFTKQQLHVLKAQILAFRRLKRGERSLPQEVLQAIVPPPLDRQPQPSFLSQGVTERTPNKLIDEKIRHFDTNDKISQPAASSKGMILTKEEASFMDERGSQVQSLAGSTREHTNLEALGRRSKRMGSKIPANGDMNMDKSKAISPQSITLDEEQPKKTGQTSNAPKDSNPTRRYNGPLFDFPFFTRKFDSFASSIALNNTSNLTLSYDVKDLLYEEGVVVLSKKRAENLKKIGGLLSLNLETKRIRPDLVLRLQIEERKLRLINLQARLRDEVGQQQQEIMAMSDRPYRKFVRQCERQRAELLRQVQVSQKLMREKQLKSIFQWRKKLLESHWAILAKYHERMLREFSKKKDDDRNRRMEALKNNDVDRYREMLLEQQTNVPGDAAQRYAVLSSFLSQTEEYLHKLGGKITAAKNHQEVEEAANAAATAARSQGLSEEEVRAAAACAGEEVMIRNRFSEMNAPRDNSVSKYYNLAHAVNERVIRQPSMLRKGTLRDYQLVGLQWMLSLYNNKLNGILADEMGLGKTVQVMALIAYLMEFKGNNGPHLIIVPNAVLVNWKSELYNWLPSVSCIFYVGGKDERSKLFSQEVCARKFNVLVTTYEFVMYDRSKLSKIDWKYIIIDEAQRMKDRESVLARDLDRYRCQRRLLLTGTPLQNDLKELWSLLNLLLPEVFDNRKAFHDWFSKPFQKDGSSHSPEEDDWLETEKKVIIIHRLHQILEPFMLRRRVEDVEGSLPPKVSIVLKCRMSAMQGAIYDWIKSTGTIRVDPEDELRRVEKNPSYQVKMYKNLNNKCMELRKACNHPLLNYPYFTDYSIDFMVRCCGKLWILDRILIKLQRAGHRVLLFSTMTKLLDILEEYLQWRGLVYRRIDGTTSLEDRESAIVDFNKLDSDCFIFLLSIRAAGRGLNLQTADTVVIYDPDPNPQNEEQAVARAHRIGQQREVKVIYMEAVVDQISSYQKEDELRNGGTADSEDDLAGRDRYMGSIESLIRNNIQQYKIDMADEVINAGRFDQRTTHEERRMTLETLLHDEERYQETVHDVPSLQQVNRMIARSEEEVELFDQMDEEFEWTGEMVKYDQVPKWLRVGSKEVNAIISNLSRKPSKNILSDKVVLESGEIVVASSPSRSERRRGRPNYSIYRELDDEDVEDSDASSEERNEYLIHEEEGEVGEFDEEFNGTTSEALDNKDQSEDEGLVDGGSFVFPHASEVNISEPVFEDAGSSGYSSGSQRLPQVATPSGSSQKFGSLSALDAKPAAPSKRTIDDLEEGEIAMSSDSHVDLQQSGSYAVEREECEDEQVLQPRIKRKRSMRIRPRPMADKLEEKSNSKRHVSQQGSQLTMPAENDHALRSRPEFESEALNESVPEAPDTSNLSVKQKRTSTSRKGPVAQRSNAMLKASRLNNVSGESWNGKAPNNSGSTFAGTKTSDIMQRKFKNVIGELQRRIDKDGHQIVPIVFDSWRRNENLYYASSASTANNILDLRRIDRRVDSFEYNGIADFVADVHLMLKNLVQYLGYSYEVKSEARKLQELFFEIMKMAFPDADLREARNTATFLGPGGGPLLSPSPRPSAAAASAINQSKRHKLLDDIESSDLGTPRAAFRGAGPSEEEQRRRAPAGKSHSKETRPSGGGGGSGSSSRGGGSLHHWIALPSWLTQVTWSSTRRRGKTGRSQPPSCRRAALLQHRRRRRQRHGWGRRLCSARVGEAQHGLPHRGVRNAKILLHKDAAPTHPGGQQPVQSSSWPHQKGPPPVASGGGGGPVAAAAQEAQWAKPVKKMRTDTGKRRPSHL
ncbi:unnamed protein product [Spirodela intermedia]|uniref:Uncharacterized protein n=1 Tax=Spirodela intermedia TaxID=51605 RepID=A0A7I8IYF4_SPIIN|nr:unnamed protein product [Spirodela intermedia]CAA6662603.1 unnamed protein product [Spirodela intermedia]